jgi:lipopolysaccharide/colanic/teichoic acid biosynthesis glycosyltransferase
MKNKQIRIIDILISLTVLSIFSILFILISIGILLFNGRPIIFKQTRVGYHGKKFKILKFRTMKNKVIKNENERLTKIGIFIRRLSLDEIPQFINVIKGEMSIVGPRPLPEINEKKINKYLRTKRRKILPGITGMSQVNYTGKSRKIEEKVKLDILYVENYSLYNYLKILIKTPYVIIIRLIKNKSTIIS